MVINGSVIHSKKCNFTWKYHRVKQLGSSECHTNMCCSFNRGTRESAWFINTFAFVHFTSNVWYLCFLYNMLAIYMVPAHFTFFGIIVHFFVVVFSSSPKLISTTLQYRICMHVCVFHAVFFTASVFYALL